MYLKWDFGHLNVVRLYEKHFHPQNYFNKHAMKFSTKHSSWKSNKKAQNISTREPLSAINTTENWQRGIYNWKAI